MNMIFLSSPWRWLRRAAVPAGLGLALFAAPARADTDAGIAYMKDGSYIKAIKELLPEAEKGDVRAQLNLGTIYYYGFSVPTNFEKAYKWYHAAALQGDPDAQMGMAILYIKGQGVTPSFAIAHMWLTLAMDELPPGPERQRLEVNRDYIAQQMSSAELVESSNLVKHWYQTHQAP
jgi:uncharacterized protein